MQRRNRFSNAAHAEIALGATVMAHRQVSGTERHGMARSGTTMACTRRDGTSTRRDSTSTSGTPRAHQEHSGDGALLQQSGTRRMKRIVRALLSASQCTGVPLMVPTSSCLWGRRKAPWGPNRTRRTNGATAERHTATPRRDRALLPVCMSHERTEVCARRARPAYRARCHSHIEESHVALLEVELHCEAHQPFKH